MSKISKVLVIGSGPIVIGQAAEFGDTIRAAVEALVGGAQTFSIQPLRGYLT